jgi:glucose-1-phosphate thymidylyltransferase
MKGVILAGGRGTRLSPLTQVTSKQLLPIYDKPLIYYPMSTLMLSGVQDILIITTPVDQLTFQRLLSDGTQFGVRITYLAQSEPRGLAHGIQLASDFLNGESFALILGDNIHYGPGLGRELVKYQNKKGAHIFGYSVANPSEYGVVEIGKDNQILSLEEKPIFPKSNIAVTGLYFYDEQAVEYAHQLEPSSRGELEITDLNHKYLEQNNLYCTLLPRGTAWLDTGTFQGLHDASTFIRLTEERTGLRIGDPADVAKVQGWIS